MRKLFYLVVSIVIFGLIMSGCFFHVVPPLGQDGSVDIAKDAESYKTNLIAGQHTVAGSITVSNDDENLFVTYETVDNWLINETHLYVGTTIPTNSAPGKFPYKHKKLGGVTTDTYGIPLDDLRIESCDTIYIAAHADLVKGETEETGWAKGVKIEPGKNWAMYFDFVILPCESQEIEYEEVVTEWINLRVGGVVEVTDETSEIYGTRFVVDPLSKSKTQERGFFEEYTIILHHQILEGNNELGDNQGFIITPVGVLATEADIGGSLEIKYNEHKLSNSGVAKNCSVNVYRLKCVLVYVPPGPGNPGYPPTIKPISYIPWEKVPEEKITHEADRVKIAIGKEDLCYLYTLTVTNCIPPSDLGIPLPGDLVYRLSLKGVNNNWLPGHVGIYVGTRYDKDNGVYNVIEAIGKIISIRPLDIGGEVEANYYESLTDFNLNGKASYMGARQPLYSLSHTGRNNIIKFAEDQIGKEFAFKNSLGCFAGLAKGDNVKGPMFNCVGLAEAAYESVGLDIVSDIDEGNQPVTEPSDAILTPQEQLFRTVPASGIIENTAPTIFWLEMVPENPKAGDSVNVTCHASDQDGDDPSYEWTIKDGSGNIIDNFDKLIKGNQIDFQIPSIASNYNIICRAFDNYGGESIIYYEGGKVEGGTAIPWTVNSNIGINHQINAFWNVFEGADGYKVYRKLNNSNNWLVVFQGEGEIPGESGEMTEKRQWHDQDVSPGNSYEYSVTAYGADWETEPNFETGPLSQFLPAIYLASPAEQATVTDSTPTLQWIPLGGIPNGFNGPGKTELRFYDVDTHELIWNYWINDVTTSSATFNQDGQANSSLISGHTYGWKVRNFAFDQNMEDVITQSEYWEFTYGTVTGPVHNLTKDTYYNTIQAALSDADSIGGDTIEVADGTYDESIIFPSGKVITLRSVNGPSSTIIRGNNGSQTATLDGALTDATLEGFTITHASGNRGGGVGSVGKTENYLAIKNCIISGNAGYASGGIGNVDGVSITITGSTISGNTGDMAGGILNVGGSSITITGSTISGNTCTDSGSGGINNQSSSITITGSTISGNTAQLGGGINNHEGSITITGSTISGNTAQYGGGIYDALGPCSITITGSTISGNTAQQHGGIYFNYLTSGTLPIGGSSDADKNTICGNYQTICVPSLDQQIRDYSGSLYEIYKNTNYISAYCGVPGGSVHNLTKNTYYDTIQAAYDDADSGNTIEVADGTYVESVRILKEHLTIKSKNGAEKTTIKAVDGNNNTLLVQADYTYINGFTIEGAGTAGYYKDRRGGIHISGVNYCTISNNIISNNSQGIFIFTSNNNMISNNIISNNSIRGVLLEAADYNIISNNIIDLNGNGIDVHAYYGLTGTYYSYNNTIINNTISNNGAGIRISGGSDNLAYLNNVIDNNANGSSSSLVTSPWNSPEEITYSYNGTTYTNYLGNYWSDYAGNDSDGNGIGDTPYIINEEPDNYPLIEPFENY